MSTKTVGDAAETLVCTHLERRGFTVLDRNWRNRWCELDIVATGHGVVAFVEVKYRRTDRSGSGLVYVGYDKAARLQRAAMAWVQAHHYEGPWRVDVAAVSGPLGRAEIDYVESAVTL